MAIDKYGLTDVSRTKRETSPSETYSFFKGDVREAFMNVFSPDAQYVLFQASANPDADSALRQYVASRKDMNSPWEVRKRTSKDNPRFVPGADDECNGLRFDNGLHGLYMDSIDEIADFRFAHYPIVDSLGVHSLNKDPLAPFWPEIFIVDKQHETDLKAIVDNIGGKQYLNTVREIDAPQNYHTAEAETLSKLEIPAYIRLREVRPDAQDLATMVDFLAQMREEYEFRIASDG